MTDDKNVSVTWKATLIGACMTLASSTAGYVSSHWGGATRDQLQELEDKLSKRIDRSDMATAKVGDDIKRYVDEKIASAEERISKSKSKKRSNGAP